MEQKRIGVKVSQKTAFESDGFGLRFEDEALIPMQTKKKEMLEGFVERETGLVTWKVGNVDIGCGIVRMTSA